MVAPSSAACGDVRAAGVILFCSWLSEMVIRTSILSLVLRLNFSVSAHSKPFRMLSIHEIKQSSTYLNREQSCLVGTAHLQMEWISLE